MSDVAPSAAGSSNGAAPAAAAPSPPGGAAQPPARRWRYPGTRAFTESADDQARFFGREQEADELYLRVLSVPLLLHFGRSGLGKTSLLQAGLFPRLRVKPLLPVMVRLNQPGVSLAAAVLHGVRQACAFEGLKVQLDDTVAGLWELLQSSVLWRNGLLLTPVLVFDQFEEVFTLRDAPFRAALAEEMGALLGGKPPARIPPAGPGERQARPSVKLVISLREDYLGALQEFSHAMPGLFQERLRLGPLSAEGARAAIEGPAALPTDRQGMAFTVRPFSFAPEALNAMVHYLQGSSGVIEPFQLQLLCRHAERLAGAHGGQASEPLVLRPADFAGSADFDTVLKNFYRDCIARLPPDQRSGAARLCEEGLLDGEGRRLMLDVGQATGDYRIEPATLDQLEAERLLRREKRLDSVFYEISHDRLAASICAARRFRVPPRWRYGLYGTLVVVPLVVGLLVMWAVQLGRARDSATQALGRAESLVSFLLGEGFLGQVRDAGLSEQQRQVQAQTAGSADDAGGRMNRGLALRNDGDIARQDGDTASALKLYSAALPHFDVPMLPPAAGASAAASATAAAASVAASAPGHPVPTLVQLREAARTHARLGEVVAEQGRVAEALGHHQQAAQLWRAVDASGLAQLGDCTAWAASRLQAAELQQRQGQGTAADAVVALVVGQALHVLVGPDAAQPACHTAAEAQPLRRAAPAPDPQALALLGQAAQLKAQRLGHDEDVDGAVALARQVRWLQPLSTTARRQLLGALVLQGRQRAAQDPAATADIYRVALVELDELLRLDPANQPWRRERATVQLLLASLMADCARQVAQPCLSAAQRDRAGPLALDALVTLRQLVRIDPANQAWAADLAWALQTWAGTLDGQPDEALRAFDEAQAIQAPLAAGDNLEARLTLSRMLVQRAEAVARLGNPRRALAGYRDAIGRLLALRDEQGDNPVLLAALQQAQAGLAERARTLGDAALAADAGAQSQSLAGQRTGLLAGQEQQAQALVRGEGEPLVHRMRKGLQDGQVDQVVVMAREAIAHWRQFIQRRPADPKGYGWLAECQSLLGQALDLQAVAGTAAPVPTPAASDAPRPKPLQAHMAAVHAADVARFLSQAVHGGVQRLPEAQARLHTVRHALIGRLFDAQRQDEALLIAQAAVNDAELQAQAVDSAGADAATRLQVWLRLSEAHYVQGLLRAALHQGGWEEAWRSGLLQAEQALRLQADNAAAWLQRGKLHRRIAAELAVGSASERSRVNGDLAAARAAYLRCRTESARPAAWPDQASRATALQQIDEALVELDALAASR